jgi:hypothetical protein
VRSGQFRLEITIICWSLVTAIPAAQAVCSSLYDSSCLPAERQQLQDRRREEEREQEQRWQRDQNQKDIDRRSTWGAIAFSPGSGRLGFAWSYYFEQQAKRDALSQCGQSDCEAVTFSNSCRGIAISDSNARGDWYDGAGDTEEGAKKDAVAVCRRYGEQSCRAISSLCSPK